MELFQGYQGTRRSGPCLRFWSETEPDEYTWDEWRAAADRAAAALRAKGVVPGKPVGCLLTNTFPVFAGAIGTWLAGGTLVSLPTPARGMAIELYLAQLLRICEEMDLHLLVAEEAYAGLLAEHAPDGVDVASFESLDADGPAPDEPPGPDSVAFVQYSSGSTRSPRGCRLTAGAIQSQLDLLAEAIELDPERDHGVMWLPLSHDMGFFGGAMLSYAKGLAGSVGPPERFLRSPRTWFEDCAETQATFTVAPNFALELAGRAARVKPPGELALRSIIIGGERLEASTLNDALEALGPSGLKASALTPAYGLAEAVLAVSVTAAGEGPTFLTLDREALDADGVPASDGNGSRPAPTLVASGQPLPGVEVRIDEETSEICISTPSLARGYSGNPELTAERFVDGELRTHDYGFLRDGRLFVQGRLDDVLIVGGRNVAALDVEHAIAMESAVRDGCCALIEDPGEPDGRLIVLAEPSREAPSPKEVAAAIRGAAMASAGVAVDECIILPRGTLPKTPSGKIQRFRCRDLVATGSLPDAADVGL